VKVGGAKITPEMIALLIQLSFLQQVDLSKSACTAAEITTLRDALPGCDVGYFGPLQLSHE
jgi:hypothetical protein